MYAPILSPDRQHSYSSSQEPLSRVPSAQPPALQTSLRHFAHWLASLSVLASPRLAALTGAGLAALVHRAALARLEATYRTLCEEVRKPENRYEAAATLLGQERPFGQVGVLRQIFGLEDA
jgi:hypothetical protein